VVKAVAPKRLLRLKSTRPAMSWAVAPIMSVQGIIKDFAAADANPRSPEARTSAATARPVRPRTAGSAADGRGVVSVD
jgi:hypothetical protein